MTPGEVDAAAALERQAADNLDGYRLCSTLSQANGIATGMAEMIPDTLPASSTAGEKRVFATLARLPDDCLIYYEPVVRRRYPDLIAILPEVAVLVIEVKDWRLAELGSINADTVTITRRGTATVVPHPRRQARGYMLRLMDRLRR
jgi:Nuclease-related domain